MVAAVIGIASADRQFLKAFDAVNVSNSVEHKTLDELINAIAE